MESEFILSSLWWMFLIWCVFIWCSRINSVCVKWLYCDRLSSHLDPLDTYRDGVIVYGVCPRCNKKVHKNKNGKWI